MKKHTRIGMMALVTVILMLMLTVPGLAKPEPPDDCNLRYPVFNNGGNVISSVLLTLPGEIDFEKSGWYGDELINVCVGVVPFGDTVEKFTWLAYGDLADLVTWEWSEEMATYTVAEEDTVWAWVWDYEEEKAYQSTYGWIDIVPDDDDPDNYGTFFFYKVYVQP